MMNRSVGRKRKDVYRQIESSRKRTDETDVSVFEHLYTRDRKISGSAMDIIAGSRHVPKR